MERQIKPRLVSALYAVLEVIPARRVIVKRNAAGLIRAAPVCGFPKEIVPVGRAVVITVDAVRLRGLSLPLARSALVTKLALALSS